MFCKILCGDTSNVMRVTLMLVCFFALILRQVQIIVSFLIIGICNNVIRLRLLWILCCGFLEKITNNFFFDSNLRLFVSNPILIKSLTQHLNLNLSWVHLLLIYYLHKLLWNSF